MKLLLDTHALIWFIKGDRRLSATARTLIETPENQRLVSTATLWEIAIKMSIGKLEMNVSFDQLIPSQLVSNDMTILPITVPHLKKLVELPFHHRDPFDRLLIAQSVVETIPLISRDSHFETYDIQCLW
ncbi:type II toxin-antitoxin system VapC family toxin [Anaerolineales bacterium HSG25]|nr:type II toxin-antitoxin system VapC family toxin [Anaerolineales bacterium HSG25]